MKSEHARAVQAQWRADNKQYLIEKGAQRRRDKRALCLSAAARVRARKKGVRFELDASAIADLQRVIDRGICEVSGAAFDLSPGRGPRSPSLDRIDPTLGYVRCNVRVILHALNVAFGDWGEDEFSSIARDWLAARNGNAIVPQVAATFIRAALAQGDKHERR